MAEITITFDPTSIVSEPYNPGIRNQIPGTFVPNNSYVDTAVYDSDEEYRKTTFAAAYDSEDDVPQYAHFDTNVYSAIGDPAFLYRYLGTISAAPTTLIAFKAALDKAFADHDADSDGTDYKGVYKFTEDDPKKIENINEIGKELARYGFTVEGAEVATSEKIEDTTSTSGD